MNTPRNHGRIVKMNGRDRYTRANDSGLDPMQRPVEYSREGRPSTIGPLSGRPRVSPFGQERSDGKNLDSGGSTGGRVAKPTP